MIIRRDAIRLGAVRLVGVTSAVIALTAVVFVPVSLRDGGATASGHAATLVADDLQASGPCGRAGPPSPGVDQRHEPRAFQRAARETDTPLAETCHLARDARRIATATVGGEEFALYVGRDADASMICLILESRLGHGGGGGCNTAGDPFAGSPVFWSASMSNENPKLLIVSGVVDDRVHAVRLAFSRDRDVPVELSADGGFIYGIAKDTITRDDVPQAVVSVGADGRVIARTPLGLTFGV